MLYHYRWKQLHKKKESTACICVSRCKVSMQQWLSLLQPCYKLQYISQHVTLPYYVVTVMVGDHNHTKGMPAQPLNRLHTCTLRLTVTALPWHSLFSTTCASQQHELYAKQTIIMLDFERHLLSTDHLCYSIPGWDLVRTTNLLHIPATGLPEQTTPVTDSAVQCCSCISQQLPVTLRTAVPLCYPQKLARKLPMYCTGCRCA